MKIIRSFLLITVGLMVTALLHAQEIKPEIPLEIKTAPAPIADKMPSALPELKPIPAVTVTDTPASVSEKPSPASNKENKTTAPKSPMLPQIAPVAIKDVEPEKPQPLIAPAPVVIKEQ